MIEGYAQIQDIAWGTAEFHELRIVIDRLLFQRGQLAHRYKGNEAKYRALQSEINLLASRVYIPRPPKKEEKPVEEPKALAGQQIPLF